MVSYSHLFLVINPSKKTASNEVEPPTDEMRVSMDDPDFKEWLGRTIGTITNEAIDLSGDVGDSVKNVLTAIGNGVKGKLNF